MNWIISPIWCVALALIFLHDKPEYMIGLILIGIARCIAMVIVWNELAEGIENMPRRFGGSKFYFSSDFLQHLCYVGYHRFTTIFGIKGTEVNITIIQIAERCPAIYPGIPFVLGTFNQIF